MPDLRDVLRWPAPVVDRRARGQALAGLLLAGGTIGLVSLPFGVGRELPVNVLLVLQVTAVITGLLVLWAAERVPTWLCHVVVLAGIGAILGLVALSGSGALPVAVAFPLVWVGLFAGFFFPPPAAAAHVVVALAGFLLVTAPLEQALGVEFVFLAAVTTSAAVVTAWLSYHRTLADRDSLTGALNQRGFARRLEATLHETVRNGMTLSVAVIDLDQFRVVNDTHGREHGDRLLARCAAEWGAALPQNAALARVGGDEFWAVLPSVTPSAAGELLERLRTVTPDGQRCSVGIASHVPGDSQSMLLSRAETALYDAKRSGRDRVVVLGDSGRATELWRALEQHELVLYYQPYYEVASGALSGVEALVRWQHPHRGLIGPGAFLPAAEESGAIHAIDRWVLGEACKGIRELQAVATRGERLRVAVNTSPSRLRDPNLVADVDDALTSSGLAPESLVVEITEEALAGEVEATVATLWGLRDLGVQLAIDDFGTGHSSLGRLRSLPFDVLKVDRSFVTALDGDLGGESLLSAIVAMAGSLGLRTVAEGVEDDGQLEILRRHGCDDAQGFGLARPAPLERVPTGDLELPRVGSRPVGDDGP